MAHKTIRLGDRGRLVIPAGTRERLGLKAGDRLVMSERAGELRLLPVSARVQALRGAWSDVGEGRGLAQELIAERRDEADRE